MEWTMPRPVLRWVAALIITASVAAFGLGVATAPDRGRLPGERAGGPVGQVLQAVEATPLGEDRIEGSSGPPELSDEEKARLAAEKEEQEAAAALAKAEAEKAAAGAITPPPAIQPPPAAVPAPPPKAPEPKPEEPPF